MSSENPGGYPPGDPRYGLTPEQVHEYYRSRPPQWLIRSTYGADALSKRAAALDEHLAYVREHRDIIRFSGPLLTDDGESAGSYAILDVPDRAAAEAFIAGETFNRAGMFRSIEITRFSSSTPQRQVELTADPQLQMFLCELRDAPGAGPLRRQAAPDHHRFQREVADRFVTRGPMLSDDASAVVGSLYIVQVADRASAEAFIQAEPMTQAGVFAQIRIDRWRFGQGIG